ncbi:DUF1810 domain-containing protein [Xanthomonas sp. WHRI 1810A]|uniref:DUF1810 domain-containing protein n=1 Tax=Xanthomonas sp. WHRI 1810A TaxID=3161565 RepID=UPI0032E91420
MNDTYDLQRFVEAQQGVFEDALAQLRNGRKTTHWMWFVFPQHKGLGHSDMAQRYAISGRDEALAYLYHPQLGPRLETCSRALIEWRERSAREIMGSPDDLKLRSCMTLFASVAPDNNTFQDVLEAFFAGEPDPKTMAIGTKGLATL